MNNGRLIGYARVSTDEQNLSLQVDALAQSGCAEIFKDEGVSGSKPPHGRSGFAAAFEALQSGDTFVVWKLDRVGRSLSSLITLLGEFEERGIEFKSLTDGIDTTTTGGRLVFHIMGALAEFERSLIQERTKAGLRAARKRGKRLGRPPALTAEQVTHARREIDSGRETIGGMASLFDVDRNTLARALRR
ncbi:recombinase family protein [Henriciella sp.]|uniref:recombinase family protein n=1 Tax=Henriciella sp. TaxID=1968823 RepID=UPI002625E7C8|nr:recombinase family protein [Henriciella sp.]